MADRRITRDELKKYAYNPELGQKKILELITKAEGEDVVLTSATSPFNMLLEGAAILTSNSIQETIAIIRSKYPDIALTRQHIAHHISDDEILGLFSKPGSVNIIFKVSVTDIISNGIRPTGAKYLEFTIPEQTVITVYNTDLTILNDIVVKYYDNNTSFVEMMPNDNPVSIKDIGIIPSVLVTTEDGHPYIYFEVRVPQVTLTSLSYPTVSSEGFTKTIPFKALDNKFYYCKVSYLGGNGTVPVTLPIGYNDEYMDPYTPKAYLNIVDNEVTDKLVIEAAKIHIPDLYFVNGSISGTIYVELYETKGGIYLPLTEAIAEDFSFKLGLTGKNSSTAVCPNINIMLGSNDIIDSGSSGMSFEEMRKAIIFNTKGNQNLPITDYQLAYSNKLDRFEVIKETDTLTERSYLAMRNIDKERISGIRALQDVYFNTVNIILEQFLDHPYISTFEDNFIIKSGAVFMSKNGVIEIVSKKELEEIWKMSLSDRIGYFKLNKYFITPFYYVISRENNYSNARVYDLDKPVLKSMRILDINRDIPHRTNTTAYDIFKNKNGYEIVTKVKKNAEAESILQEYMHNTLAIELITGNKLYIDGVYDSVNDVWRFDIETNHYLSVNNELRILNGMATTSSNYSKLITQAYFILHTTDSGVAVDNKFLKEILPLHITSSNRTILAYEAIVLELGSRLESILSKIAVSYTPRKYKKYPQDVLGYYTESVLEKDEKSGWAVKVEDKKLKVRFLHKKGEPMLDDKGNQIVLHKKGDVILDHRGMPTVDDIGGMVRHIDVCMLDYEFYMATQEAYAKYNELCIDQLRDFILRTLPLRNDVLLENTSLSYKSYKTILPIKARINNIVYGLRSHIRPKVVLYYNVNTDFKLSAVDLDNVKDRVGFVIDKYLENSTIKLNEIEDNIRKELGEDVIAVKITGIDNNDSRIIVFEDTTLRLSLYKELILNEYNKLEVKYDIDVSIQTL